jgi:hypothetical protein
VKLLLHSRRFNDGYAPDIGGYRKIQDNKNVYLIVVHCSEGRKFPLCIEANQIARLEEHSIFAIN